MPTTTTTGTRRHHPDLDAATAEFLRVRPRLLAIAQHIRGDRDEAEDIVQDAWLRWQRYDRARVVNPTAFLVTTTSRLAMNAATSARARYEDPVDDWIDEPAAPTDDPTLGTERREVVDSVISLLLERLDPVERAAYVLRHAFDYPYSRIARRLDISEVNARQVVSRAGRRIGTDRCRPVSSAERLRLVAAFAAADRRGDLHALEVALLDCGTPEPTATLAAASAA
jgi:RNA polymerase sigma-70 factor (ECF subfamily)